MDKNARRYDVQVDQGEDFELGVTVKMEGLTTLEGCTFVSQIREDYGSPTATDLIVEIDQDPTTLTFLLSLAAATTAEKAVHEYVWDCLMIEPSGRRTYILYGTFAINPTVTNYA